jgi:hypothetical protein
MDEQKKSADLSNEVGGAFSPRFGDFGSKKNFY